MKKTIKMILYWFLQCTWGIIMTLAGAVGAIVMLCKGEKPKRFGYAVYFVHGHDWGGVCLGGFFFVSQESDHLKTKTHEYGHSFQNALLGPLFPFVVGAPSMIRYHLFARYEAIAREKFSAVLFSVGAAVSVILILAGTLMNLTFVIIVAAVIGVYSIVILGWLFLCELSKIDSGKYGYYDVWFEHHASEYGMKVHNKNSSILKYE